MRSRLCHSECNEESINTGSFAPLRMTMRNGTVTLSEPKQSILLFLDKNGLLLTANRRSRNDIGYCFYWIPAFAGMTVLWLKSDTIPSNEQSELRVYSCFCPCRLGSARMTVLWLKSGTIRFLPLILRGKIR